MKAFWWIWNYFTLAFERSRIRSPALTYFLAQRIINSLILSTTQSVQLFLDNSVLSLIYMLLTVCDGVSSQTVSPVCGLALEYVLSDGVKNPIRVNGQALGFAYGVLIYGIHVYHIWITIHGMTS